jgi:hypothetical protein
MPHRSESNVFAEMIQVLESIGLRGWPGTLEILAN